MSVFLIFLMSGILVLCNLSLICILDWGRNLFNGGHDEDRQRSIDQRNTLHGTCSDFVVTMVKYYHYGLM